MRSSVVERTRRRVRLVQLLEAAETAALSPIPVERLHAFAYLADVLSPVWELKAFDKRLLRTRRTPYYPDLQNELDTLVVMGLVEVISPFYFTNSAGETELRASFALRFGSRAGAEVQDAIAADEDLRNVQFYLNELASALASLPDEEISDAASRDDVYKETEVGEVVDVAKGGSRSAQDIVTSFEEAFPGARMSPGRRLYMYAQYLGQSVA